MKIIILPILILLVCNSCKKEEVAEMVEHPFNTIPTDEYYSENPLDTVNLGFLDGIWQATHRTQGTTSEILKLPADFDYLRIKPNGIFGIQIGNQFITYGKIEIVDTLQRQIRFVPEIQDLDIDILNPGIRSISPRLSSDDMEVRLLYSTSGTVLKRIG